MRIEAGVGDLVWRIRRSSDVVCDLYHTHGGEPQNLWQRFVSCLASKQLRRFLGLGLKTRVNGLVIWASKSPLQFLGLGFKTKWEEVCRFVPQNRSADEDGVRGLGFPSFASKLAKE
jgi:hypothetical protein